MLSGFLQDISNLLATFIAASVAYGLCVLIVVLGVPDTYKKIHDDMSPSHEWLNQSARVRHASSCKNATIGGETTTNTSRYYGWNTHPLFSWAGLKDSIITVHRRRDGNKMIVVFVALIGVAINH